MTDIGHFTVDFDPSDDGWWRARCHCGWEAPGVYPSAEDAADALMDHAFRSGWMASATSEPPRPKPDA